MVPTEWSLVDLGESETTALIGVSNVSIIVVEVVEGTLPPAVKTGAVIGADMTDGLRQWLTEKVK
jgi:hypothetical protein